MRRDDPSLTVRLDGSEEPRTVAILSASLELKPAARVFAANAGRVIVYTGRSASDAAARKLDTVATIERVGEGTGGLDLEAVLRNLAGRGMHAVMIEGGGKTLHGFLERGLAQRAALFHAPVALGAGGATPMLSGASVEAPAAGWTLERESVLALGRDQLTVGRWASTGER